VGGRRGRIEWDIAANPAKFNRGESFFEPAATQLTTPLAGEQSNHEIHNQKTFGTGLGC
jgi:hypothetical protein